MTAPWRRTRLRAWVASVAVLVLLSAAAVSGVETTPPLDQAPAPSAARRLRARSHASDDDDATQAASGDAESATAQARRAATTPPPYAPVVAHQDYSGEYQNGTVTYVTLSEAFNNATRTVSGIRVKVLWDAIGTSRCPAHSGADHASLHARCTARYTVRASLPVLTVPAPARLPPVPHRTQAPTWASSWRAGQLGTPCRSRAVRPMVASGCRTSS